MGVFWYAAVAAKPGRHQGNLTEREGKEGEPRLPRPVGPVSDDDVEANRNDGSVEHRLGYGRRSVRSQHLGSAIVEVQVQGEKDRVSCIQEIQVRKNRSERMGEDIQVPILELEKYY